MDIDHPFHVDGRGRTATTDPQDHVRDMILELLLTSPGERVNRPNFGAGLLRMVFAPNSPEMAAALQASLQASLQQWLGDVIDVASVEVSSEEATLSVVITYVIRQTGQPGLAVIPVGGAT